MLGARNRADVDHAFDAIRFQKFNEVLDRPRGMSDREYFEFFRAVTCRRTHKFIISPAQAKTSFCSLAIVAG